MRVALLCLLVPPRLSMRDRAAKGSDAGRRPVASLVHRARRGATSDVRVRHEAAGTERCGKLGIDPDRRFLYRLEEAFTGVGVEHGSTLVPVLEAYPNACR
ncbi:MAG: hypothetical protein AB8I08_37205 [Sandaracinaceae bacterium]